MSAYPAGYVSGLRTFFRDLAHDSGGHHNVDSVSAQYNDLTGAFARYQTTFGGALVDTDSYPATECPAAAPVTACLTDAQIQDEVATMVSQTGIIGRTQPGRSAIGNRSPVASHTGYSSRFESAFAWR